MNDRKKAKNNSIPQKQCRQLIAISILAFLLATFYLLRGQKKFWSLWVDSVTGPFKRFIAYLCSLVKTSVAEWLLIIFVIAVACILVRLVVLLIAGRKQKDKLRSTLLGVLIVAEAIWLGMCLLWNANYYAADFHDRTGITGGGTVEELYQTTMYFSKMANECAYNVKRDENDVFAVPLDEIVLESKTVYRSIEAEYPFLDGRELAVKPVIFSEFMSRCGQTTGVTFPFTGECCINVDQPFATLPFTAAHEIAHQRNIASEQEANYLSVLACIGSENDAYVYSGYLSGYIYLCNALYREHHTYFFEARSSSNDLVRADLIAESEYWKKYENTKISAISDKLYDGFLKGNGQEQGVKSYGTVIDLLIAYYKNEIAPNEE